MINVQVCESADGLLSSGQLLFNHLHIFASTLCTSPPTVNSKPSNDCFLNLHISAFAHLQIYMHLCPANNNSK
jgi:hypothetical protein